MKLVCISDTHNKLASLKLPPGDLLIISGDILGSGVVKELIQFNHVAGLIKDKYKHGIMLIAGNHDMIFEQDLGFAKSLIPNVAFYLQDDLVEIEGIKFYGAPWQPRFYDWAFNVDRGPKIKAKWDLIPDGVDVLITHGPVAGIHDVNSRGESMGCNDLLDAVLRVKPKFHICGHNHHGYGVKEFHGITFVNASSCNERYMPVNPPIEIEV